MMQQSRNDKLDRIIEKSWPESERKCVCVSGGKRERDTGWY